MVKESFETFTELIIYQSIDCSTEYNFIKTQLYMAFAGCLHDKVCKYEISCSSKGQLLIFLYNFKK